MHSQVKPGISYTSQYGKKQKARYRVRRSGVRGLRPRLIDRCESTWEAPRAISGKLVRKYVKTDNLLENNHFSNDCTLTMKLKINPSSQPVPAHIFGGTANISFVHELNSEANYSN
jgi:hypothetical protein